jgi:glucosamine--fructose-6-phosphate aminotransferase (isomerizing)
MCGIFGIVCDSEQLLGALLTDAGRRLSYRGYDSVGCATMRGDGTIDLRKDVGKVDDVARRLGFAEMSGSRGIVQLRWATFGHPSKENAQPHIDSDGDLVGAHNGNVVNNVELRQQFIAEGMTVRSANDGESCVHAVERYIDQGCDFIEAIRCAYQDLEGDYAFVIGRIGEDRLYAIKKGSGLVAGIADGFTCISSDLPSILPLTRQIVRVNDGEIVTLTPSAIQLHSVADGSPIARAEETVIESMEAVQKGGYAHFMLKEIHEQPALAAELLHLLDRSVHVDYIVERTANARHLYLVGCGTSFNACLLGSVYLAQLSGRAAVPVLAPQFIAQYAPTLTADDVGIFVSQSGETKDVLNAIQAAQTHGIGILGLVNVIGSTLTQVSERYIPLACGYEISVPATKTYTNQVIALLYLAMRMGRHDTRHLVGLPALIEQTIQQSDLAISGLIASISGWDDLYCVGYGYTYPVAMEGALKLKEITYAHCEGMLSTEFKHGPLSAVRDEYPVIFVAGPEDIPLLISGINEVTCRSGRAIVIGPQDSRLLANAHDLVVLPPCEPALSAILAAIPLQMLAYRISVARGINPDFPRNLSKTLTVD